MKQNLKEKIYGALLGIAIGDALGVPVEFKPRKYLEINPITDLIGYGTHNQPPGTWSDDSSLTFCLAESLLNDFDLLNIANHFINWQKNSYWTAHNEVFDIGISTAEAIRKLKNGASPLESGNSSEQSNGNGSLMRILPMAFYLLNKSLDEKFELIHLVSSITHAHIRSVIACFIYNEFAQNLINGLCKEEAYEKMQTTINGFLHKSNIQKSEIQVFNNIMNNNIASRAKNQIHSTGYVVHSLEATFWSILNFETFSESVLNAVNLGDDTDTTGAITGGIAGIIYGINKIPAHWKEQIARKKDIEDLSEKFYKYYQSKIFV